MNNKKKTLRDILYYDKVYNNPRSDRQDDGMDDEEEEKSRIECFLMKSKEAVIL